MQKKDALKSNTKESLRNKIREFRKAMSKELKAQSDAIICAKLSKLKENGKILSPIAIYLASDQ